VTHSVVYGSQNCVLFLLVGRKLPKVENHWSTLWLIRECLKGFFFKYFFGVPHLATCIFLFFYNEPELSVEIDPGMALTPLPSSIGWGLNSRPSDYEPSALLLVHGFCLFKGFLPIIVPTMSAIPLKRSTLRLSRIVFSAFGIDLLLCSQFHQNCTSSFYIDLFAKKITKPNCTRPAK